MPAAARHLAIGRTPVTGRRDPSSASSPRNASPSRRIDWSSARRIAIAIAKSNPVPSFGNSAGARLTVTRRCGNLKPALRIAGLTRSRASWIARSVRPTIVKPGRPLAMSASTVTGTPASPLVAQLIAHAITQESVAEVEAVERGQPEQVQVTMPASYGPPASPMSVALANDRLPDPSALMVRMLSLPS